MKTSRRRSRAEWQQAVEAWRESGLGVREFCRQRGLKEGRFYLWRKKFGLGVRTNGERSVIRVEKKESAVKFLPMQIKEVPDRETVEETKAPQRVEIFMGNGSVVRFSGELSEDNLSRIMKIAAGAPC